MAQIFQIFKKMGLKLYCIFLLVDWLGKKQGYFAVNQSGNFLYLDHFQKCDILIISERIH